MAKPIFIVGFSEPLTDEYILSIEKKLEEKLNDYHILIYSPTRADEEISFHVFNQKDGQEIDINELKEFIKTQMDGNKDQTGTR